MEKDFQNIVDNMVMIKIKEMQNNGVEVCT